jgi:hypothetical protein
MVEFTWLGLPSILATALTWLGFPEYAGFGLSLNEFLDFFFSGA